MPQGLQTWDENGTLMLGTDDSLGRILDVFDTGTANGSRSVPGLTSGTPFLFMEENSADLTLVSLYAMPNLSYSGTTVTWAFVDFKQPFDQNTNVPRRSVKVSVGVF